MFPSPNVSPSQAQSVGWPARSTTITHQFYLFCPEWNISVKFWLFSLYCGRRRDWPLNLRSALVTTNCIVWHAEVGETNRALQYRRLLQVRRQDTSPIWPWDTSQKTWKANIWNIRPHTLQEFSQLVDLLCCFLCHRVQGCPASSLQCFHSHEPPALHHKIRQMDVRARNLKLEKLEINKCLQTLKVNYTNAKSMFE